MQLMVKEVARVQLLVSEEGEGGSQGAADGDNLDLK